MTCRFVRTSADHQGGQERHHEAECFLRSSVSTIHPHAALTLKNHVDAQAMHLPWSMGVVNKGWGEGLVCTRVRMMMSAGDTCPAIYIARTGNLHGGILYWPAQHVLVKKGQ